MDRVQNPTTDKPAESSPVKVVITEGCVSQKSQTDVGNVTKVQETELSLNPGSPLVMTHHINLVQGACTGSCETEMATLKDRVEFLEKEMAAIKKMCVQCSGEQCPNNCSGQGKCEEGKCVCFQGFSGPDCSGKACPSNCNKKGKCVKGKCVCQTDYTGPDCSKAVDKKITVTVETVSMKIPTAKPDTKPVKTKPDKTIFVKRLDATVPRKNTTAKPTAKPSPTVSPDKAQSNTTKRDKIIKTIGQVLLRNEDRRQEQAKEGKTTIIKLDFKQTKTNFTDKSKKNNLKDESVYQNVTQKSVMKVNGTSRVLENVFKGTKESYNATVSKKKVTIKHTGHQLKESKTVNVTSTSEKDKKLLHSNVTTALQTEKKSDKHVNGTSFESKTHSKHFNKTISRLSVIGSVEVHNITSAGFIMSWEAPQGMFKNFTITRKEIRGNEDTEKIHDGAAAENVTDVQRPGLNRTSTKVQISNPDGRTVKKFPQVLAGTARSYNFKGLQPQTRYSVSLFGSGLGIRSKIHRLTLSTGPEPPTDLIFSNITETSFSVSWTKPKSIVAEFKVTYTNTVTGESGSMSVDSQLSHVLLSKLSAGSTYDITVSSVLETLQSEPITASVTTVPDSPTELKVVNITDTKALLVWKPSQAKVDSYILSYGTTKSPNVTITVTLSGSTVAHQLRGLHRSSLYMVKITSQVNRLQSRPVSITFTTEIGVKLQVVTPEEVTFHSAVISWRAPRVAFRSYRLTYQLSEDIKEVILNPSVTHYELSGLAAFSNYTVKIEAERDGQYISFVSADFTTAQRPHPYPTDCSEVQFNGKKESGEAEIYPEGKDGEPVLVYCDMETDGGGWTVFQRRMDGSTDFFRSWRDYSRGFGLLKGEFWLGNDILHTLTSRTPMSLRVDLRSGNDTAFAHYANFNVSSEVNHYAIELSGYFGTAGDSMKYHNGRPFSTKDKDPNILSIHCAKAYMGGWWYKNCYKANLNGLYASYSDNKGVVWIDWKGKDASLPFTEMKLRPSSISQTILTTPTTQVVSVVLLLFILWMLVVQLCGQTDRQRDGDAKASNQPEAAVPKLLHSLSKRFLGPLSSSLPGPLSLPFLGNMLDLAQEHLPIHLTSLAQRYGNIYRLNCGNTTMVILNNSEIIREALIKKWSDFAGRPYSYTGDIVSSGGRTISLGDFSEEWKAQRRVAHGALQRCTTESLHSVIEKQAHHLCQVLRDYNEKAVDLSEDFTVAASNVITTLTLGKSYDKSSVDLQKLQDCLNKIVSLWGSPWISALDSFPLLRRLPNPPFSRLMKEVARRDELIGKHIEEFKKSDNKEGGTVTSSLLQSLEPAQGGANQITLTDTHVHMTTVDLLIGGTETTAALLNWTVAFLLHRPEVQNKVYEELCGVLDVRYPQYSDRSRLPYLCALINEMLRLRPVAPLAVPHRAIRNSSIAGHFIPKNTIIIPNLYGAHHDPEVWDDPYSFKPERFLEGGGGSLRALIPFGGGARLCLGEAVAKMEMFLFTAYLLRDFQFLPASKAEPLPDLRGIASVVLKVKPYTVIAHPREQ
ncbi:hypothetical protein Q8A67_007980 [Cirrhinus molitorella]|uniref:Steroid 21-hydroxylase n=1 Tax=Cirrhinus molitorella TaxID=172907 RepID=A0AA88U0T4_9TELE|nr:hypothetical protein Q8A67_007980 [Cirrhinus molitorella]